MNKSKRYDTGKRMIRTKEQIRKLLKLFEEDSELIAPYAKGGLPIDDKLLVYVEPGITRTLKPTLLVKKMIGAQTKDLKDCIKLIRSAKMKSHRKGYIRVFPLNFDPDFSNSDMPY